jgi:hypothetical protein
MNKSRKNVLVFGSVEFETDAKQKQTLCQKLGVAIVSSPDFVLVTGGALAKNPTKGGADYHAARGAYDYLSIRDPDKEKTQSRITTVIPAKALDRSFEIGTVIIDHPSDVHHRRQRLVDLADAIITVEGGPGTMELFQYAVDKGIPFIPIGGSGGASRSIWEQPKLRSELQALTTIPKHAVPLIESQGTNIDKIVSACRMVLSEVLLNKRGRAEPLGSGPSVDPPGIAPQDVRLKTRACVQRAGRLLGPDPQPSAAHPNRK